MASIFSRIAAGEIPSYRVGETDRYYAFLDINPVKAGHVLVIPKKEVDYLYDLDDEEYVGLQLFVKQVATAMKRVLPCRRIATAVIGLEVPHAHIHLIPIERESDLDFRAPKKEISADEMKKIAETINTELEKIIEK